MSTAEKYEKRIKQLEAELNSVREAVNELKLLNEIALASGKAGDVDQTLNVIVQKAVKSLDAEQGLIYLITPQKNAFQTIINLDERSTLKNTYRISDNITGWCLLNEKPLLIENLANDKRFKPSPEEKADIHSVICSPVWYEGKIIGIILVINKKNKKSFNENELTLLSIIAVQAGQLIKNSQMQKEAQIKLKEAELAQLKSRFFTNISHEFRTPLTLILGPADKLLLEVPGESNKKQVQIIRQNALRLLGLINELMDLSKLEAGKLKLEASLGNISAFVKGAVLSFESLAEQNDITLKVSCDREKLPLYFDRDKMLKIISNLISNAIKFTPQNGTIEVSVKEPGLPGSDIIEIVVKDTGIGIPEEETGKLFERFYQVESAHSRKYGGTGVGLALTKELVELHHGTISVTSTPGKGTRFTISLKQGRDHLGNEEIIRVPEKEEEYLHQKTDAVLDMVEAETAGSRRIFSEKPEEFPEADNAEDRTIILVVEDNADVREFIKCSVDADYLVYEASNGEQGVRRAESLIPDIIISDIMMPRMNGQELTQILKSNEKTSHIPIILLTAVSEQEAKLQALGSGADDYLTKPFDASELQLRVKNLISIRRTLQEKYSKKEFVPFTRGEEKKLNNVDEKFISRIKEIMVRHIGEEQFSIEDFGKEAGMSRVQLHRKLKALTGKSASLYLRSFRLSEARKMLVGQKGNVSEIAYSVGFSSPAYFTRCFKEEFGYPPSEILD